MKLNIIKYELPALARKLKTADQYPQWRTAVESTLRPVKLWEILSGDSPRPDPLPYQIREIIPNAETLRVLKQRDAMRETSNASEAIQPADSDEGEATASQTTRASSQRPAGSTRAATPALISMREAHLLRFELENMLQKLLQWESDDRYLTQWLLGQIDETQRSKVSTTSTARELWQQLEQQFQISGAALHAKDYL
ncbi:hypothetical protein DV736_g6125, partial [Chaetothyriales sp. CBS 134916]